MTPTQEAFNLFSTLDDPETCHWRCFEAGWQACLAHVKATYVLCEKKPITSQLQQDFETGAITSYPLYREAK